MLEMEQQFLLKVIIEQNKTHLFFFKKKKSKLQKFN